MWLAKASHCYVLLMFHLVFLNTKAWRVHFLGQWMGDSFWGVSRPDVGLKPPEASVIRKAKEKEFPFAALCVFNTGHTLTGALITKHWVISATAAGLVGYSKNTNDQSIGRVYLGVVKADDFKGEGIKGKGMKCPGWTGDMFCEWIMEAVPQDTYVDTIDCLVMMRLENPLDKTTDYVKVGILAMIQELPYNHREQCYAVWYAPTSSKGKSKSVDRKKRSDLEGAGLSLNRTKRQFTNESALAMQYYDQYVMPLGLWHVGHCRKDSRKKKLACEDTFSDEEQLRSDSGHDKLNKGHNFGGPSRCSPQYRSSAVAVCQKKITAFRLHAVGGYEVFMLEGKGNSDGDKLLCSPISDALRRLWVLVGPGVDWVYYQVLNREEKPGLWSNYMVPKITPLKLARPVVEEAVGSTLRPCALLIAAVVTRAASWLLWTSRLCSNA